MEPVATHFRSNLDRVRNLILLSLPVGVVPGEHARVLAADLLRLSVVLLHSTLEHLLRSLAGLKLPNARRDVLAGIDPFTPERSKFTLAVLRDHSDLSIADFINKSVAASLEGATYNNVGQVATLLDKMGVRMDEIADHELRGQLASMIQRRHLIAHRADRDEAPATDDGLRPIDSQTVLDWFSAAKQFGESLISQVSGGPPGPEGGAR